MHHKGISNNLKETDFSSLEEWNGEIKVLIKWIQQFNPTGLLEATCWICLNSLVYGLDDIGYLAYGKDTKRILIGS